MWSEDSTRRISATPVYDDETRMQYSLKSSDNIFNVIVCYGYGAFGACYHGLGL